MGAGIKPGIATPHGFDRKLALVEIHLQKIGDLQLAPRRRLNLTGAHRRSAIQKIKPRHRVIRRRHLGFFNDLMRLSFAIKGDHAVTLGVGDVIAKDGAADLLGIRCRQKARQPMAKKDVIAQHQRRGRAREELFGQNKGLRQTIGAGLLHIGQADAPLAAIAQEALELIGVLRRGDNADLANTCQHQHGDRIIDHRLVIKRQELL